MTNPTNPPYQEGEMVRIKDNAFEGTDDPKDLAVRGRIGEVCDTEIEGLIYVTVDGKDWPLTEEEIERIE